MSSKFLSSVILGALAAVITLFAAWPADAAWTRNPYAGNLAICTQSANQDNVVGVPDGAGGAILVWQDSRGTPGADVYAQRVNAAGVPQWTVNGVALCTSANDQTFLSVVADGSGGAIVAWQDLRSGTSFDIYAQRVNAAGTPQWTANGAPVAVLAAGQTAPSIASDGAGGAVIAWIDARTDAFGDVYAQRLNGAGAAQWTANGVPICAATASQANVTIASDGANGAIVSWEDYRSGFADLYAQRVNATGAVQWLANGAVVSNTTGDQTFPQIVSDGFGGAILVWQDSRNGAGNVDIYGQRLASTGVALWAGGGSALCSATGSQYAPKVVSDGAGGAICAWEDYRGTSADVYAQHVTANGTLTLSTTGLALCTFANAQLHVGIASDGRGGAVVAWEDFRGALGASDVYAAHLNSGGISDWASQGVLVGGAIGSQYFPSVVLDGAGGAIVAWTDYRGGTSGDVYVDRVDAWGELGEPAAVIRSVKDVVNDQGGFVKLTFAASPLDVPGQDHNGYYECWRSVPIRLAMRSGRGVTGDPAESARSGQWFVEPNAASDYAWEPVGIGVDEAGLSEYSFTVPTTGDSMPGFNPRTAFRIRFTNYGNSGYRHWFSAPDSGYSVDNRAPVTPAPFAGVRTASSTRLTWWPNHEADLAGYRVYRGLGTSFVPGPGTLMSSQVDTGYVETSAPGYVFKVTAVDIHGNESAPATFATSGTVDAPGSAPALAFAAPTPNPARASTTLRWSLPAAGTAKLEVYDAAGRRVRVLHDGPAGPGEHSVRFDLRDGSGRALPSGVYLARLEAAGQVLTRRITAID